MRDPPRSRSEHLVHHVGVIDARSWGSIAVGHHCVITTISRREVVVHFGIELLDSLLLVSLSAATTAATTTGTSATTSLTGVSGSLRGSNWLGLVLLRLAKTLLATSKQISSEEPT